MPRVYCYLLEPASTADNAELHRQLHLAGLYRRLLVWIENGERDAIAALYAEDAAIVDAEARCRAAFVQFAPVDERRLPPEIKAIKAELSRLRATRRALPEFKAAQARIQSRRPFMTKAARAHVVDQGLFWGSYQPVEEAHSDACTSVPPWERVSVHGAWNTVAIHVQGPKRLTFKELLEGRDLQARISATPYPLGPRIDHFATIGEAGVTRNKGNQLRPAAWRTLQLRTGSTGPGRRTPVWTNFHVMLEHGGGGRGQHAAPRRPPEDAHITWVKLIRTDCVWRSVPDPVTGTRKMAPRERWELQLTVNDEAQRSAPTGLDVVGIDIGWRRVEGGIRVAYAARSYSSALDAPLDTPSIDDELVIPDRVLTRRQHADDIRSIYAKHLNSLLGEIQQLRQLPTTPAWFLAETTSAHLWKRLGHFVRLVQHCATTTDPRLGAFKERALAVLKQDQHLREYEAGDRRRQRLQIEGLTCAWISRVLAGHRVLGIEAPIRIDRMVNRATAASEGARQAAVANREVSPGALRVRAIQMAISRGIRVVEVPPAGTTSTCPACREDRGACDGPVRVICSQCGFAEDQDRTAAREIARRARDAAVAADGSLLPPPEVKRKPKFRRTRKKADQPEAAAESPPSASELPSQAPEDAQSPRDLSEEE